MRSSVRALPSPELRAVRRRSSAGVTGSSDLYLRVHVLRRLRRERPAQRVPELRRRLRAPADPPAPGLAARGRARERSGRYRAPACSVLARGDRAADRAAARRSAGAAVTAHVPRGFDLLEPVVDARARRSGDDRHRGHDAHHDRDRTAASAVGYRRPASATSCQRGVCRASFSASGGIATTHRAIPRSSNSCSRSENW